MATEGARRAANAADPALAHFRPALPFDRWRTPEPSNQMHPGTRFTSQTYFSHGWLPSEHRR